MLSKEQLAGKEVRLFPAAHISSSREAELRAAASLLAMVRAVNEFGRMFVRAAGGPAGRISCYTEVAFKIGTAPSVRTIRPDGIVRAVRGKKDWAALVEVKVGDNPLDQEQVDAYHRLARDEGFDALITVSNQAALPNGLPPVAIDKRRLRATPLVHLSWERLLADAKVLSGKKEVEDPDQAWMLDEWIKYVADEESRIIEPPVLGRNWNSVVSAARENKLASVSNPLQDVVEHWDAFLRKAALGLRAKMGVDVQRRTSRADVRVPAERIKRMHAEALANGVLTGALKIPGAIGDLGIEVMLHGRKVRYSVGFRAPDEGKMKTRLTWLLRQLRERDLPPGTKVQVDWDQRRLTSEAALSELREDHAPLLVDLRGQPIPRDAMPKAFQVSWTTGLARGRGRAGGHVLVGISAGFERFYREVIEGLIPFVPKAPKLPSEMPAKDPTHKAEPASEVENRVPAVSPLMPTPIDPPPQQTESNTEQDFGATGGQPENTDPVRLEVGRSRIEQLSPPISASDTPTTQPGYRNRNSQVVIRNTGLPGNDHLQTVYELRCQHCDNCYGANGSDIFQRRCPGCQGGAPGLALS